MLELRRTAVTAANGAWCETALGPAWSDPALHPAAHVGDEVIVNVQARELGLGSGGYDLVVANLTRGLGHTPLGDAHVMKLNYTPLQHAVEPADGAVAAARAARTPVAVLALHGQLPALAWGLQQAAPGARLSYVQTAGGALPGRLSNAVAELRERGWLDRHLTAGPAYGGEQETISTAGAIAAAIEAGCQAVVCGPGPGILGSGTELGHGGLIALDTAHAALALGLPTVLVARVSGADPRPRHRGISHHTRTVLELLLAPVVVPLPAGEQPGDDRHEWRVADGDLDGFPWPLRTMGREDPRFFAAAAAAGRALAAMIGSR